ncbi:hypothetical protein [Pedobacter aquatilis]|uniref:hypothetical protein n=1 Tax=Pedobacter aquatilis TaxID=351343 RepID=UPI0029314CE6|nr:hypothetical protein [Pedobacter aquatilis]
MFSDVNTDTKIFVHNNQTVVISRVLGVPLKFRIYIDGANKGYIEKIEGQWQLTEKYGIPSDLFELISNNMGV